MNRKKNKAMGFTLIELLVVVAIISLLSSISLAALSDARKKAVDAKILGEYKQLQVALELYYNENGEYPNPNPGNYCISDNAADCSIAGENISGILNDAIALNLQYPLDSFDITDASNLLAATFSYKPSSTQSIDGNKGFVYQKTNGNEPSVIFATHKTGVVNATVGVWTLSEGSNSN